MEMEQMGEYVGHGGERYSTLSVSVEIWGIQEIKESAIST